MNELTMVAALLIMAIGGVLNSVLVGGMALVFYVRAKREGRAGSWLRFSIVSIIATIGLMVPTGLAIAFALEDFGAIRLAVGLLGATPGLGVWVGFFATRNKNELSADVPPAEIE